jgi:GNAT superfamily N-acetyltransferase
MSDDEQPLRTGWESGAPAGDSLTRAFLLNSAESLVSPVRAMGGRVLANDALVATDLGRQTAYLNSVTSLQPLNEQNLDEVLSQIDEFYGFGSSVSELSKLSGVVMLWSAWPTPDLRARGWNLAGHPPLHLLPAGAVAPPDPPELDIRPVTDKTNLEVFEETAIVGFPFSDLLPYQPGSIFDERVLPDTRMRRWVGWVDGKSVGLSASFIDAGVINVALVATLPEARGKGYGAALTWRAALAEPGLPAMLLSSDMGRPIYDRMGFLPLYRFTLWYRDRS